MTKPGLRGENTQEEIERGKREPKKLNLRIICVAILGEDASAEEVEQLFWKGWSALGGREGQAVEHLPDEEYLQNSLMGYSGDNPVLTAARATAESVAGAIRRAGPTLTGDEPEEMIVRGRRKGILKVEK